ncbi:MAG: DnaA/Hda family protein [Elusimicrobia bacterium]|nr:DnaA/Hda family protein [Elusimicrobiota bacterium]
MIKKWEVSPAPSEKNSARHKLLIKGEMKDIFLIVKKLGGLCSRPEKASGEFNFTIYLSKLEMETMTKLKEVMGELSAGAAAQSKAPDSGAGSGHADAPEAAPELFELPKKKIKIEPEPRPAVAKPPVAAARSTQAPAPRQEPAAAPPPRKASPAPEPRKPEITPPPAAEPKGPSKFGRADSGLAMPPAAGPASAAPSMNFMPSETARAKKEESDRAKAPKEDIKPASAPEPAPAPASKLKARWSMELPLIPTYSFQTLVAGSHNRFAHAAAMAVVENPGVIYNPLLVFGVPGTGKTHFVHSVSYGLSSSIGQNNIFVTDGIKLSKGVEMAINEGTIARLEEMFSKIKALIIDDIHLLMISPSNKRYISKWLNDFVAQNKQIMLTSVFPPKSLSGLEDAVGFQFTQGWMVDLKLPAASSYKLILSQLLQSMDVKLSEDELNNIFVQKSMPFGEVVKVLESMKKLEKMTVNASNSSSHSQLVEMLLGTGETDMGSTLTDDEYSKAKNWSQPGSSAWFKWGIFYPQSMEREARFVLYKMHERAAELGLRAEWTQVFMEEYNSDETYGIPFKIGNYAAERGVNGVIVLGPQPSSALGSQEAEFKHITFKILDSYLLKGAWIPAERIKSQAVYTKTLMDLI